MVEVCMKTPESIVWSKIKYYSVG